MFIKFITGIDSNFLSLQNVTDSLLEQIFLKYKDFDLIEKMCVREGTLLPLKNLEDLNTLRRTRENKLSSLFLPNFFNTGQKKKYHYKQKLFCYSSFYSSRSDLSMLEDFYKIKDDLSIVNGCFVTLRDPLKYCGKVVHIRDTKLLGSRRK